MDPLLEQLLAGFVDESQEIYDRVTKSLMELEKQPAQGPSFDELARGLHTLKGSAATLGLDELADFAHRMEDVVLPLRGSPEPVPAPIADAVLKSLDVWMARLRATAAKGELPDLASSHALLEKVKPAAPAKASWTKSRSLKPLSTNRLSAACSRPRAAYSSAFEPASSPKLYRDPSRRYSSTTARLEFTFIGKTHRWPPSYSNSLMDLRKAVCSFRIWPNISCGKRSRTGVLTPRFRRSSMISRTSAVRFSFSGAWTTR